MKTSDNVTELYASFVKFQAEVKQPKKNATNPFYKSKYTTLDEIINTVNPVLGKHGLAIIQEVTSDGASVSVTTRLIHESGQWLETEPMTLKGEKATPQGQGSATSYGRRYALSAILGISSEDDDDGNIAEPKQNKKPKMTSNVNGNRSDLASPKQIELITNLAKRKNYEFEKITEYIKKEFEKNSSKELTKQEASKLIEMLNRLGK